MTGLSGRFVSAAVAGLCLLGVLGVTPAAAADGAVAPFSCGSFGQWGSAPSGSHFSATAVLGSTTATLEGTIDDELFTRGVTSPTLVIRDNDTTVRSGPVNDPIGLESPTETATPAPAASITPDSIVRSQEGPPDVVVPLCVVRFPGSPHPVVLMGLYTGGAHCCTVLRAYPLVGSKSGPGIDVWIGNPGVDIRANPRGKGAVIVTGDDAFNYEFAAYALSGVPLKVLTFRKGGFADVTREYPGLVRHDAARWWKSFSDNPAEGLGTLAAWAADQCLLGKGRSVWATINRLLTEGKLAGDPNAGNLWPTGADYVATLHAFLSEHGYCR